MYVYIGFKTSFCFVRHLDSIASCLPTGLQLGFLRSWPSLYLPSSFSSVFLVLSFSIFHTAKCSDKSHLGCKHPPNPFKVYLDVMSLTLTIKAARSTKKSVYIYKYTMKYQSNTTKLYYVYYCIKATCFDSYRIIFRPFSDTDPYLAMFKMRCGIPNAYIWDPTAHFKRF